MYSDNNYFNAFAMPVASIKKTKQTCKHRSDLKCYILYM